MKSMRILWWGKSDTDYSRNRILIQCLERLGHKVIYYRPRLSLIGDLEYRLLSREKFDIVWLPCFRQRDGRAALRLARSRGVPLLVDTLISAYDKQVYERQKFSASSRRGRRLRSWEAFLFSQADIVFADTAAHVGFFIEELDAPKDRTLVLPVGAEEDLFRSSTTKAGQPEVLFYGSYVPLQGAELIVAAAKLAPEIQWTLLGDGKGRSGCEKAAKGAPNLSFEGWCDYEKLPARIRRAQVLLGIFGDTPKAQRVIPNKVYQSLACGRPVITAKSPCYVHIKDRPEGTGLIQIDATAEALADAARHLLSSKCDLAQLNKAARETYDQYFSVRSIETALQGALKSLDL